MTVVKDLFGNNHTIRPCSADDVDVHFAKIINVVPSEEVIQFKKRMSECINAGSAYTLSDGSCFFYYLNEKPCCASGVALVGKRHPLGLIALFVGIFTRIDPKTFTLNFALHPGMLPEDFKSLFTETSLRRNRIPGYPLIVRIDHILAKVKAMYNKRGIRYV